MRDFGQYLKSLGKHWASLLTGAAASLALLLWGVFAQTELPRRAFWVAAVAGIFVAGYLTWREEHARITADADGELRDLASTMVQKYVTLAQSHSDEGPHALATLNLAALGSDVLIRETIHRMDQRIGRDPWEGWARFVEDVDLVSFFTWTREHRGLNHPTTVRDVAKEVKAAGGHRPKTG